jgi:hypothetical protein
MADRIRVTFTDLTGSRHADVTLRSNLTGEEVVDRLIQNDFLAPLESGQTYVLKVKGKDVTIQPSQTLESAGVEEGNILVAGTMTRGGRPR